MSFGKISLTLALACTAAAAAFASAPSFTVRCMRTSGAELLDKYGTYYFFLTEGQVKGYACAVAGRPCLITKRDANTIVFKTPGDDPDVLTINLRDGSIRQVTAAGEEATYACRQLPND